MNSVALAVAVIARADLLVATGVGEGGTSEGRAAAAARGVGDPDASRALVFADAF